MSLLSNVPEEYGTVVIGAVLACLGYLSKVAVDWWKKRKLNKSALHKRLLELDSLLSESESLFLTQNELARRLLKMLQENHKGELPEQPGYERAFTDLHDSFTQEEQELHSIIRGITMNSLQRVNQSMSKWLNKDFKFKTGKAPVKKPQELAEYLVKLEHHLNLWHDKYKVWIPNNPRHALVYMADEENHGKGFPKGIEKVVDDALKNFK